MDNYKTVNAEENESTSVQYEDMALKTSMQFFAEELLPYLGIEGKVVSFAPTELVHLDMKKLNQDFNLVMEDGAWKHFEFQSTNEGLKGLKRFRSYEALTSYQHGVNVTTYVLYSGQIKNPMTEFTSGINTYRIHPIIMREKDGDQLIQNLQKKAEAGIVLTKQDLVPLTLCPLMGGTMSQKDRIRTAFSILQHAESMDMQTVQKIEAVVYAMAEKFLEQAELNEIMEDVRMTRLGQMLMQEGIEKGRVEGRAEGIEQGKLDAARKLLGLLDATVIAERIGLPLQKVMELKKEMKQA